jgi:hypothetical protein
MLTALVSLSGSPGCSVLSQAVATMWPGPVLLAECDPAGGAIAFGYLRGESVAHGGLYASVTSVRRAGDSGPDALTTSIGHHVFTLDAPVPRAERLLWLPGFTDPGQASAITSAEWVDVGSALVSLAGQADGVDVIADCGRLFPSSPAWPLLRAAHMVVVVVTPTRTAARQLHAWLPMLTADLERMFVVLNGPGEVTATELARAVDVRVVLAVDDDGSMAAHLAGRGPVPRHPDRSPLLVGAATLARELTSMAAHP